MSTPAEKGLTPAYGSFKTMMSFTNDIKDLGHIPLRIDRTQMTKLSGGAAKELLATLRFLGMVHGEKAEPTPVFEEFVNATDDERRAVLNKVLRSSYSFLFSAPGFHIERGTGGQVSELFREHGNGITGSTLQRAISFFLAAAKEAGIKVSPSIKPPKSANTGTRPKREKKNDALPPGVPQDPLGAANEPPPPGVKRLEVPMPDKPSVVIFVPESIDADDWAMVYDMLKIYVKRWKGYDPESARDKAGAS